jgi:hypothetical protein
MIDGEEAIFLIIEIERGLILQLAVTAILPSLLRASPNGWGATLMVLPADVRNRPLGRIVVPSLLTEVYKRPAGADKMYGLLMSHPQPERTAITKDNNPISSEYLIKPVSILTGIHNASVWWLLRRYHQQRSRFRDSTL